MEIKSKIEEIKALKKPMQVYCASDHYQITGYIPDHLNPAVPDPKIQAYNEAIQDVLNILEAE